MKQLLFLALIVFAAWYGWHHYTELRQAGSHQVIVVNHTGHVIERLRVKVGEQAIVVEVLENGQQTQRPFLSEKDGPFQVTWELRDVVGERNWSGGVFMRGPILLAHRFEFREGDGVIWSSQKLPGK